jgi:hypothetical protein
MLAKRWLLSVPSLFLALLPVTGATGPAPSRCEIISAWFRDHSGYLPSNYAEYIKVDEVVRPAVYASLTQARRMQLWQEQLDNYAGSASTFTSEQRQFIAEVRSRLPMFVSSQASGGAFVGAASRTKAYRLFGEPLATRMFFQLGPTESYGATDRRADGGGCNCNSNWGCSGTTWNCILGNCIGNLTYGGCGLLGNDACLGQCLFAQ